MQHHIGYSHKVNGSLNMRKHPQKDQEYSKAIKEEFS